MSDFKNIADFLFEVGMLAKTPRSGFFFLGSGEQSVSEHTTRTIYIGYTLAMLNSDQNIDTKFYGFGYFLIYLIQKNFCH